MKISLKNFKETLSRNEMRQVSGGKVIDGGGSTACSSCTTHSQCGEGRVCWGSYSIACGDKRNVCY